MDGAPRVSGSRLRFPFFPPFFLLPVFEHSISGSLSSLFSFQFHVKKGLFFDGSEMIGVSFFLDLRGFWESTCISIRVFPRNQIGKILLFEDPLFSFLRVILIFHAYSFILN